jgi:hypothetical protein
MVSDQTHDGDGAGGHKSSSTAPAAAPPPAASAVLPLERFGAPDFSPDACVTEMRRHVRAICVHSTCMPGAVLPVLLVSTCHTPPFAATHPRTGTAANSEAGAAKASDTAQGQGTHRTLSCCSVVIDHCDTRASSLHQRPPPRHHTRPHTHTHTHTHTHAQAPRHALHHALTPPHIILLLCIHSHAACSLWMRSMRTMESLWHLAAGWPASRGPSPACASRC